jgi:hypothetical protein
MSEGEPVSVTLEVSPNLTRLLGHDWNKTIQAACYKVALVVHKEIAQEPGPSHQPVIWASDLQRRGYFAWRRSGGWPLHYQRGNDPSGASKKVASSYHTETLGDTGAMVYTNVDYAPYVQADAARGGIRQQPQHFATGWVTDKQAVDTVKASGKIETIVKAEIADAIKG